MVFMLLLITSGLDLTTFFIESSFPLKSGMSDSTIILGHRTFMALIVLAMCSVPPSFKSSLQTAVITTYLNPHTLIALATLSGSSASSKTGLRLLTAQNLHALLHMFPMIIIVAVPVPQHSPMLGHLASSQTV